MPTASDASILAVTGQILIAVCFLGTALINSTTQVTQHRDRMVALGVPYAGIALWIGFAVQYVGSLSLLLDIHRDVGAVLLIAFTLAATAIFHRFWRVPDPLMRHLHRSYLFVNIAIVGALLLIIAR